MSTPVVRRRRHLLSVGRLLTLGVLTFLVIIFAPTTFVASKCWGDGFQAPMRRPEAARNIRELLGTSMYLTLALPEWAIADTTGEYARFIAKEPPSHFPYFSAINQVPGINTVRSVRLPAGRTCTDTGTHVNLGLVGTIYSLENIVKGLYENSFGWLTERFSSRDTPEDAFASGLAAEYAAFMQTEAWYSFPFADRLVTLWTSTPLMGEHMARKWERQAALPLPRHVLAHQRSARPKGHQTVGERERIPRLGLHERGVLGSQSRREGVFGCVARRKSLCQPADAVLVETFDDVLEAVDRPDEPKIHVRACVVRIRPAGNRADRTVLLPVPD